ncbi:MAG: SRPBCC family protein [Burkholderiales bacterium]
MEMQGEKLIGANREAVWEALNDPAVLQRCVPGCDAFDADRENRFKISMQATVGPVRARFAGKLELRDIQPPTSYALSFEGSGGVAGFGKGTAEVRLSDGAEGGTRLNYAVQAQVGGRLAQVGARLIDGVTKRMADDFYSRFVRELDAQTGASVASQNSGTQVAVPNTTTATVQRGALQPVHSSPPAPHLWIVVLAASVSATAAAVSVLALILHLYLLR